VLSQNQVVVVMFCLTRVKMREIHKQNGDVNTTSDEKIGILLTGSKTLGV